MAHVRVEAARKTKDRREDVKGKEEVGSRWERGDGGTSR